MKLDNSAKLTLLYCLFSLLYTCYLAFHPHVIGFRSLPGDYFFYNLEFLLLGGYVFFILQGLILGSKNWGILLLLPLAIIIVTFIAEFLLVRILAWGGGTLLNNNSADMILTTLLWLSLSYYSLRWIRTGKKPRKRA